MNNLSKTIEKKTYYLDKKKDQTDLIIANCLIDNFNFNDWILLLSSKNILKYKKDDKNVIIIQNIDVKLFNENKDKNLEEFELANIIGKKNQIKTKDLNYILLKESSSDYHEKIKPYIENIYNENTFWIHEIFKGNREKENIVYQDDEIVIIKELSMTNIKKFYLLGFPKKKITNIREIEKSDLILLDKIINKIVFIAKEFYGINEDNLINFFHYHPSFYHLHIHSTFIENPLISNRFNRHHLYEIVKNNIIKDSNFYKKCDLYFEIPRNHVITRIIKNDLNI